MDLLSEDCLSTILSFTSPLDACSSSLVSSSFRFIAESDIVWDKFLPVNYPEIISSSVNIFKYNSKKQLFQLLCNPTLIDHGNKCFKLEKCSGKKIYVLSAKELSIAWSNQPLYWCWKPLTHSRFPEVAELRTTDWLEIQGKIKTGLLSPNTTYGAYLIIKITDRSYGLDLTPSEVSIQVGSRQVCTNTVHLCRDYAKKQKLLSLFYRNRTEMLNSHEGDQDGKEEIVLVEREDGWLEVELGEFFSGENYDEEVTMSLLEVKGYHLKGGLIVEGIELRPIE
ncbi:hypothetical protein ACFE04_027754 [Oxalis oulophora]